MKKVATEIPENEFKEFLEQLKEEVLIMKNDGLGYVSITCALAKKLTLSAGFDELTFTASQIKSILDLAKKKAPLNEPASSGAR